MDICVKTYQDMDPKSLAVIISMLVHDPALPLDHDLILLARYNVGFIASYSTLENAKSAFGYVVQKHYTIHVRRFMRGYFVARWAAYRAQLPTLPSSPVFCSKFLSDELEKLGS